MKRILLLFIITISFAGYSQDQDAWVYFNDKPNSAAFFANPLSELSQRSLDRRTNQGIALTLNDAPIEPTYITQVSTASGITVMAKSKWLNCVYVRGVQADIDALTSLSFVNHIYYADNSLNLKTSNPRPIVPVNKQLSVNVNYNYGTSANQVQMLNVDLLHQANYTGVGKQIAVLDAGFPGVNTAQPFQRLITNGAILGGYDYVNKSTNFYSGNSHGTMVLSTMGGYTDGQLVGTAPDAKYYLYITEDVNSENPVEESNWVEAAEQADRVGVDIITTSLGYFGYDNPAYGHDYSDMTGNNAFASQGANIAFTKGIVVVASAGNSGSNSEPHIGVPAEANNVLAIGAVQANRTYAGFSSIGPSYDGRMKPDVMAQGQASVVSNPSGTIQTASGTSFSCPIMAGSIASFWSAMPNLTNQQVVNFVKQSADRYTNPDYLYGYGIPNFQLALSNAILSTSVNNIDSFSVFPNPTQNSLTFKFLNNSSNKLLIYNNLGQLVLENNNLQNNQSVDVSQLNSGIYLYKISSDNFNQSGKFIKQ